jgi:hypothetical protein
MHDGRCTIVDRILKRKTKPMKYRTILVAFSKVTVDGKPAVVTQGTVDLPVNTRTVELQWSRAKDAPTMSYRKAVEDYKAEYRKRYEASIH